MTIQSKCVANVHKAVGESFTKDEVKEVVDQVFALAERDQNLAGSVARKLKMAAREQTADEVFAAKRERMQRALNIRAEQALAGELAERKSARQKGSNAIDALTVGKVDSKIKAGYSTDAQIKTREGKWRGGFMADLESENLLQYMTRRDPEFERAVAIEMFREAGGSYAPSGNSDAVKFARIGSKWNELGRVTQNNAGAAIAKRKGYIVAQTHDQIRIAKAGDAWINRIADKLDEETFVGVENRQQFLQAVRINLATGNHMRPPGEATGSFGFKGPGNLAKRVSQERVLIFKSPEAWLEYNREFGTGSVFDGIMHGIDRAARNSVLMERWGTNPQAMFDRIVQEEIQTAKDAGDVKEVARLETGLSGRAGFTPGLRANFEAMSGASAIPGNPTAAMINQNIRSLASMAKLGGMVLSMFPDLAMRASVLRHNGMNYLDGLASGLRAISRGRGSKEYKDAMWRLGVGHNGMAGALHAKYTAADQIPGRMAKAEASFYKWNGSNWVQDVLESGMGFDLAANLAEKRKLPYEALPRRLQNNLTRYGISPEDWKALQSTATHKVDGVDLLLAENVADEALRNKLEVYYVDQSREGMTMGGAAERAWVSQFGPPGSLPGEVARYALQFKNFSLTYVRRHLMRELGRDGFDGSGLALMIVWSTALGYVAQAAKDIAKGREPRDPSDPETWGAAFMQGGGLGIYGDFLLGEYNRFGNTLGETLAGPAVGIASDWLTIFAIIASGAKDELSGEGENWGKIGSAGLKAVVNSTPYANLFYTRVALDYLVLYQLQEALDPGSLRRMEQRIRKENNQEFIVSPSRAIPRGGGDRVFEGLR